MSVTTAVAIVLLVLVNALYVAAEFAIVSARRSRIRQRAEDGQWLARRLLPLIEDGRAVDRYISACQFGITVSSLALGAVSQQTLAADIAPWFADDDADPAALAAAQSTAAVIVLLVLSLVQVVAGEAAPKSIALTYPNRTALFTLLPVQWTQRLFHPFITLLDASSQGLVRLFGLPQSGHRHVHSPGEIGMLIDESHHGGLLNERAQERLQQALDLGARRARHLMVPRPRIDAIDVAAPSDEILRRIVASPFTRMPAFRESIDHVVGIVRTKDVVTHVMAHGPQFDIQALLKPVFYVHEGTTADRVIALMRDSRTQVAIVMDDFGGVAGLVTIEDVLAEVFGDVGDEFSEPSEQVARLPDGRLRVPGMMRVADAQDLLDAEFEAHAATVGGMVVEVLGHMPTPGETLVLDGVRLEVEQVTERVVSAVLVTPRAAEGSGG